MSDRCTGDCCRNFWLPFTPEEIRAAYVFWRDGGASWTDAGGLIRTDTPGDIDIIDPMVRPVAAPDVSLWRDGTGPGVHGNFYRCVHLQENGDCGIYEIRPVMCCDFPYNKPCVYRNCSWDAGRRGEHLGLKQERET